MTQAGLQLKWSRTIARRGGKPPPVLCHPRVGLPRLIGRRGQHDSLASGGQWPMGRHDKLGSMAYGAGPWRSPWPWQNSRRLAADGQNVNPL